MEEEGLEIPKPDAFEINQYSGKLTYRIGKSLHKKISELAYRTCPLYIHLTGIYWQSVRFGQFWKDLERFLKKI